MSEAAIKLLAQWLCNNGIHNHGDANLSLFFSLDYIKNEVYVANRIKLGFQEANKLSIEAVIQKVLKIDQQIDKILSE